MKKIFTLIFIIILAIGAYYGYNYYIETNMNSVIEIDSESKIILISQNSISRSYIDQNIFDEIKDNKKIPGMLLRNLGFSIFVDDLEKVVSAVNSENLFRYKFSELSQISTEDVVFNYADFSEIININFFINEESKTILYINNFDDYVKGKVIEAEYIYGEESLESLKIGRVEAGEIVFIEEASDNWYRIVTGNLVYGYIPKERVSDKKTYLSKLNSEENIFATVDKINLTWEAVYSRNPDTNKIPDMIGLNAISPTWFSLKNAQGDIDSKISKNYISWAKGRNYKLWPLVTNSFDPDMTHEFLNSTSSRIKFIDSMISIALENNFDGINIDFENIYLEDKDNLTHFVGEFAYYMRKNNLVSSIDVTVMGGSDNWSKCIDREKISKYIDYMMIMAYDQYWASSPVSGPVAAYDWVDKKMAEILEIVPAEKLILGIPLYMRIWYETPSEEKVNFMNTKSKAIGMESFNNLFDDKKFNLIWDDVGRHYYVGYIEDNMLKKIWVEDGKSIREKASLVKKYNLAGVATWRRGFETEDIWPIINDEIKK